MRGVDGRGDGRSVGSRTVDEFLERENWGILREGGGGGGRESGEVVMEEGVFWGGGGRRKARGWEDALSREEGCWTVEVGMSG